MHMKTMRRYTKKPQLLTSVRLPQTDRDLLFTAARQRGISQSEAVRQAVRAFATSVLLDTRDGDGNGAR
jgi:Ribbon-helix-helix protein, copG family